MLMIDLYGMKFGRYIATLAVIGILSASAYRIEGVMMDEEGRPVEGVTISFKAVVQADTVANQGDSGNSGYCSTSGFGSGLLQLCVGFSRAFRYGRH